MSEPHGSSATDQCKKSDSPVYEEKKMVEKDQDQMDFELNRFTQRSFSLTTDPTFSVRNFVETDGCTKEDPENRTEHVESEPVKTQQFVLSTLSPMPRRKLILHFDARNTVFVADISSRITIEQALNTYLSGIVWGK